MPFKALVAYLLPKTMSESRTCSQDLPALSSLRALADRCASAAPATNSRADGARPLRARLSDRRRRGRAAAGGGPSLRCSSWARACRSRRCRVTPRSCWRRASPRPRRRQFGSNRRNHSERRDPQARHTKRASRSRAPPAAITAACSSKRCSAPQRGQATWPARTSTTEVAWMSIGRSGAPPRSSANRRSRSRASAAASRWPSRRTVLARFGFRAIRSRLPTRAPRCRACVCLDRGRDCS